MRGSRHRNTARSSRRNRNRRWIRPERNRRASCTGRSELYCPRHLVCHARLTDSLHVQRVTSTRYRIAAEAHRIGVRTDVSQRHQVLSICADVRHVVIDGAEVAFGRPLQRAARYRRGHRDAVIDPRLDLSTLFVVIPRHQLQGRQLFP